MSEPHFDTIIVGGGIAGCTSALLLARAGLDVLLLERGQSAGSKNVSGGRLYTHSLEAIIPGFTSTAPLERQITQEKLTLLSADSAVTLDYRHPPHDAEIASYSVLRARFDPWLMAQAEAAGAQCLTGVLAERLLVEQRRVTGVQVEDDRLYAHCVILAEGANTLLSEQYLSAAKPAPSAMAIGVKEVLALSRTQLEDRFTLNNDEGAAWLFAGAATQGQVGGGFIYTNRDSLSLGVVCPLSTFSQPQANLPQMLESFKQHPVIKPLLKGSELLEYSAHLVPESGLSGIPTLSGPGYLVVGDAARLCINTGHTVRGMDLAVVSAQAAAQTLIDAGQRGNFGADALGSYRDRLRHSAIWPLLMQYRRLPETLLQSPHFFTRYPQLATELLHDIFHVSGDIPVPLRNRLWRTLRKAGLRQLLKDGIKGMRSL